MSKIKLSIIIVICLIIILFIYYSSSSIKGPEFQVSVSLSEAAREKLLSSGETILIHAVFDGDSIIKYRNNAPHRSTFLGFKDVEIKVDEIAKFNDITFSKINYYNLLNGQYYLAITATSGRRKFNDNILDCYNSPSMLPNEYSNKLININCNLSEEDQY